MQTGRENQPKLLARRFAGASAQTKALLYMNSWYSVHRALFLQPRVFGGI